MSTDTIAPCKGGDQLTENPPFGTLVCTNAMHYVGILVFPDPAATRDPKWYDMWRVLMVGEARPATRAGWKSDFHLGSSMLWPSGWHLYNPERIIETKEEA